MSSIVVPRAWERARPARLLFGVTLVVSLWVLWAWPSLPAQDPLSYLKFADERVAFGIPRFGDVATNLAFLGAGAVGLGRAIRARSALRAALALAAALTAAGSAYFHLDPTIHRLFWDRLPMAIGFSAVIALLIEDRVSPRYGLASFLALAAASVASLVLWRSGALDLRPYIVLQYGGLAFVALLAFLSAPKRVPNPAVWAALGLYGLAKIFELLDGPVYDVLQGVASGHNLKHFFAALALLKLMEVRE